VLFSDGLSEAVNKQGGMLGEEGVQNFIQSLGANISAESLAVGLDENSSFTINDDLTLLVALSS
jgi:serine phosphatase RsbU (regulator of sigma subunit)